MILTVLIISLLYSSFVMCKVMQWNNEEEDNEEEDDE